MAKGYHEEIKFDKTEEILEALDKIRGSYVTVGIHESAEPYDNDPNKTVAMIGAVQEFGSTNTPHPIPERSYLRSTYDENFERVANDMKDYLGDIALGKLSVEKALAKIGFFMTEQTKAKIEDLKDPPNAESTAKAKKFNNPLIDSRKLKNSIDYEVTIRKGAGSYEKGSKQPAKVKEDSSSSSRRRRRNRGRKKRRR